MQIWTSAFGWFFASSDLTTVEWYSPWLPTTGEHFLLSERHGEEQLGHKEFEHDKRKVAWFLAIFTGSKSAFLYTCLVSHQFVFYSSNIKETLEDILKMDEVTILPGSVFIYHGYLQHTDEE